MIETDALAKRKIDLMGTVAFRHQTLSLGHCADHVFNGAHNWRERKHQTELYGPQSISACAATAISINSLKVLAPVLQFLELMPDLQTPSHSSEGRPRPCQQT